MRRHQPEMHSRLSDFRSITSAVFNTIALDSDLSLTLPQNRVLLFKDGANLVFKLISEEERRK